MKHANSVKEFLLRILDFLRFQVENDKCTMAEMQSFADMVQQHADIDAEISDIAKFYGKTESHVRTVASRNYFPKGKAPKRRVLYNFASFTAKIPACWRGDRK